MKAIVHTQPVPVDQVDALRAVDVDMPNPGPKDLLVKIQAVSVNPVDTKVRSNMKPEDDFRILGYDAAGTAEAVGSDVTAYKVGDEVFYAGDITRPGSNAEYQLVDERIVGQKPLSLDFKGAAAMPLTSITAWEILFDSFNLSEGGGEKDAILIIGGAGGVGSILIQLAKKLTGLTVVASASRKTTRDWAKKMGADHIVNHHAPLNEELKTLGITPRYVAGLTHTEDHWDAIIDLIKPRGKIAVIDGIKESGISDLKSKALTLSWEYMFTRPIFETEDMTAQRDLLNRVSQLLDDGTLQGTQHQDGGKLSVESLIEAHKFQESGKAIGKTVLSGF